MKKKLFYSDYFSFFFWLGKASTFSKPAEIEKKADRIYYETDIAKGSATCIKNSFVYIARYLPLSIVLLFTFAIDITFRVEYLFSFIFALITAFIFFKINLVGEIKTSIILYFILLFSLILLFAYAYSVTVLLYSLLVSVKIFVGLYLIIRIINDYKEIRSYSFFLDTEKKLVQRVRNGR